MSNAFLTALATAAAKKGVDAVAKLLADAAKDEITIHTDNARAALLDHLQLVANWSEEHTLADAATTRPLRSIYEELTLADGEVRSGRSVKDHHTRDVAAVVGDKESFVILGPPGAGKTTTLQHIAREVLAQREAGTAIVPILVRFRNLAESQSLIRLLLLTTGVSVSLEKPDREKLHIWERRALTEYLESIGAVLLLDGLDEAPAGAVARLTSELSDVLLYANVVRAIVTCRLGAYLATLPRSQTLTLLPLRADQVAGIAHRWFGEDRAADFLKRLGANPVAGAEVIPLILSQLCAVYERRGDIPEKPTELYEVIIRLLIEDFDVRRGIVRKSQYARLTPTGKERFLRAIAHELTRRGYRGTFQSIALEQAYLAVCSGFDLPPAEARQVALEIESHTGLLVKTSDGMYSFPHKTYQEYLTASHLLTIANPFQTAVPRMPDELAIMIALSPEPTDFLRELLAYCVRGSSDRATGAFLLQFLERLAIERPDFRAGGLLGWSLIGICHLVLASLGSQLDVEAVTEQLIAVVAHLGRDPRIASSVATSLAQAFLRKESPQAVVLALRPRVATSGEEAVFEIFAKAGATFALPERFLSRMAELPPALPSLNSAAQLIPPSAASKES